VINISYLYSVETNAMLELTLKNTEHGALPGNGYGGFCIATIQPPSLGSVIMEIWKDIEGYEGYYQASNYGNIKSIDRVIVCKNGAIKLLKGKILKTTIGTPGYYITDIHKKGNVNRVSIHRLIGIMKAINKNKLWDVKLIAPDDCPYRRESGEDKGTCALNDGCETELEWQCSEPNCPIKID